MCPRVERGQPQDLSRRRVNLKERTVVTWEPAVCRELRQGKGPEGKGKAGNQGLFQPSSPGLPCRLQCGGIPLVQVHMAVP